MSTKSHWETVYSTKPADGVSWYQPTAERSLRWIRHCAPAKDAPILDVGGGASVLADNLLDEGHTDLCVLDLSGAALAAAQKRLGARRALVKWREADVTAADFAPASVALWHDRAVFHFLADEAARAAYAAAAARAVRPGGFLLLATFAADGPERCSGLSVCRYDAGALEAKFQGAFTPVARDREIHATPFGTTQAFTWCLLQRN